MSVEKLRNKHGEAFMWRAVYTDGTVQDEFDEEVTSIKNVIGRNDISEFGIVNINGGFLSFDTTTGVFSIMGSSNVEISVVDQEGNVLDDGLLKNKLVMFRTAEQQFVNGLSNQNAATQIVSYSTGYRYETDKAFIVVFSEIHKTKGLQFHLHVTGKVTEKMTLKILVGDKTFDQEIDVISNTKRKFNLKF